eukprot:4545292-Amphidinium_carterae.1
MQQHIELLDTDQAVELQHAACVRGDVAKNLQIPKEQRKHSHVAIDDNVIPQQLQHLDMQQQTSPRQTFPRSHMEGIKLLLSTVMVLHRADDASDRCRSL